MATASLRSTRRRARWGRRPCGGFWTECCGRSISPPRCRRRCPGSCSERYGLPPLGEALQALHHPAADADVEALNQRRSPAHLRLVYGELLELQVALALVRRREEGVPRVRRYQLGPRLRRTLAAIPPFPLTGAQERAIGEILADLDSPHPMLRLLQGDVGSGKTIVAALALAAALESGYQGAFMAPTELLAEQHYASLARLLGDRYGIVLVTGSTARLSARLASGEARLAVGTHALFQEAVEFQELGLAVIDEQHRFGVAQRDLLRRKGDRPDLLVMTATPIPRSLALTAYGDLAVSTLDELPPGRSPVATELAPARQRPRGLPPAAQSRRSGRAGLRGGAAHRGERCSMRPRSPKWRRRVRETLAGFPVATVHGRMPAAERERACAPSRPARCGRWWRRR